MDEIPAEFADLAATKREAARRCLQLRRRPHGEVLEEEDFSVEDLLKAALRKAASSPTSSTPSSWAPPTEQGRRGCSTPSWTTCQPARRSRRHRHQPRVSPGPSRGPEGPFAALAFKIADRPVRGQAHLHPRVLWPRRRRFPTSPTPPRTAQAHRPHPRDERQPACRP